MIKVQFELTSEALEKMPVVRRTIYPSLGEVYEFKDFEQIPTKRQKSFIAVFADAYGNELAVSPHKITNLSILTHNSLFKVVAMEECVLCDIKHRCEFRYLQSVTFDQF